jgi:asparagine synthase (glutamine-hydrolysing)
MLCRLRHRGPDDQGVLRFAAGDVWRGHAWEDGEAEAALLHWRLSIIDLSETGWQPMTYGAGRYYLIFNGEIYNYLELRPELEGLGHQFVSQSDTEVLLAAYTQWGAAALNRLVGMFAFAILDTAERTIFLARDCFGIKPLYYTVATGGFAFASEIPPLLDLPAVSRNVNP